MKKLFIFLFALFFFSNEVIQAQTATLPTGDGTIDSPYLITSWENLYWLSQNSSEWGKYYEQINDIDFADASPAINTWNAGSGWAPIGNSTTLFTGTYDGGCYRIDNLYINRPEADFISLFGNTSGAEIKNLGVTNVDMTGATYVSGLIGRAENTTKVTNCYATGAVTGNRDSHGGAGGNNVALLVGENITSSTVTNCYAIGNVLNGRYYVGVLVGSNHTGAQILNSYARGAARGMNSVGALAGSNTNSSEITNCYSFGSATAYSGTREGGITGYHNGSLSVINASFWNADSISAGVGAIGSGDTTGAIGVSSANMKVKSTFTGRGWDFIDETANGSRDDWNIDRNTNNGCPFLNFQPLTLPAGDTDYHLLGDGDVGVQFTIPNTSDLEIQVIRHNEEPEVVGILPGAVENLAPIYWTVRVISGTLDGTYSITLYLNNIPGIWNCPNLYILKRDNSSSAWEDVRNLVPPATLVHNCPTTITAEGLTALSEFVIGGEEDNPLPVEMSSFNGVSTNAGVTLNWKTASEKDNEGFLIFRNGLEIASYTNHEALKGQRTKSSATNYSFTDQDVYLGDAYTYTLVSVDLSGERHQYGRSVTVNITEEVIAESGKAERYALEQNYPNPFNPSTVIRYSLKNAGMATIKVFDMLGREVLSETRAGTAGWNTYHFNAGTLASGIYYYRIIAGSFVETRKMMLLK